MSDSGSSQILQGKQVIIGGSWQGEQHECGAQIYKISGIGPSTLPSIVRRGLIIPDCRAANELDFRKKIDLIIRQSLRQKVVQISSMPVWLMTFFERVGEMCGLSSNETLKNVWPEHQLCLYAGASIRPYRHVFERWLGDSVDIWELYSASEGAIAVKESKEREDLLVLPDIKTFFEFVPVEEYAATNPRRVPLWEVEAGREYVVYLTNPNGLFSYCLGDTVRFTTVRPYRLRVTGRTSFYLNTMGEHITGEVIEQAVMDLQGQSGRWITEYTVGPGSRERGEKLHHDWILETAATPLDMNAFRRQLDTRLAQYNSDYKWFRKAGAMTLPNIVFVPPGTFSQWISVYRNDDPQTKIPKVRNDRQMIDQLMQLAA